MRENEGLEQEKGRGAWDVYETDFLKQHLHSDLPTVGHRGRHMLS